MLRTLLAAWLLWLPLAAGAELHHALVVSIDPEGGRIEVEDTVSLGAGAPAEPVFALHPELAPELLGAAGRLIELPPQAGSPAAGGALVPRRYRVELAPRRRVSRCATMAGSGTPCSSRVRSMRAGSARRTA